MTTTTQTFKTMADVRAANEAAGYNWFRKDTMKWWKSRVESSLIRGRFFISSEDDWNGNRIYCVREALPDGRIKTHKTHLQSRQNAKDLIRELSVCA